MAQQPYPADTSSSRNVWPSRLLANKAFGAGLSCVRCGGLPTSCKHNKDGEILCNDCSKNVEHCTPSIAVQRIINSLKTQCLTLKDVEENSGDLDEGTVVQSTGRAESSCDWVGKIEEWPQHRPECEYLAIHCDLCKKHQCIRKDMKQHLLRCPEATVDCPMSCGARIRRKEKEKHITNVCTEQVVRCNNDDCKMEMKRKELKLHMKQECDARIVSCPYHEVGCSVQKIKACDLPQHIAEFEMEHLSMKFTAKLAETERTMNEKLNALRDRNRESVRRVDSLQHEVDRVQEANRDLTAKLSAANLKILQLAERKEKAKQIREIRYHPKEYMPERYHPGDPKYYHPQPKKDGTPPRPARRSGMYGSAMISAALAVGLHDGYYPCCNGIGRGCQTQYQCCGRDVHSEECQRRRRWQCCGGTDSDANGCQKLTVSSIEFM